MAAISIVRLGHRTTIAEKSVLFGGLDMVIGPELEFVKFQS
jgi:hypothetical protein